MCNCKLYTLFAFSSPSSSFADTVHRLSPFSLHPWSTGGLFVAIVSVPFSWTVTPSFSGWKIVVYPSSDSLFTLINDCRGHDRRDHGHDDHGHPSQI